MSDPSGRGPRIMVAIAIATILLSISGTAITVTWRLSNYSSRLKAMEDSDARKVSHEVYEADQKHLIRTLDEINEGLKEIRRAQLREAEGRRRQRE